MFIAITESKKVVSLDKDDPQVNFEKHKIFLYKEDFEKFMHGLQQAIDFIGHEQGELTAEDHAETPKLKRSHSNREKSKSTLTSKKVQRINLQLNHRILLRGILEYQKNTYLCAAFQAHRVIYHIV